MIVFVWRRHENISMYTASRVRTRYELIGSSDVYKLRKRASESQATAPPAAVPGVPTTRPWPIRQKLIVTNLCYQTPGTIASRFWIGTILHWAAFTWQWRMCEQRGLCTGSVYYLPLNKMVAILADDIFKWIFLNENGSIPIQIALKFVPGRSVNNKPALVQVMAWCLTGDKP